MAALADGTTCVGLVRCRGWGGVVPLIPEPSGNYRSRPMHGTPVWNIVEGSRTSGGGVCMDEERPVNQISRRKALKRIGAGAAIAWSAPVLSSLRTPAFAQETPRCQEPCDFVCGGSAQPCGAADCLCDRTTERTCFCLNDAACDVLKACTSTAECPPGWGCVGIGCCPDLGTGHLCLPPCGTSAGAAAVGATFSGR